MFEEVVVGPAGQLAASSRAGERIEERALAWFEAFQGALATGIGQRALDEAAQYALQRQQFGQPIADFPAVRGLLADTAVAVEAMRLLSRRAAWEIDRASALGGRAASVAWAFAVEALPRARS